MTAALTLIATDEFHHRRDALRGAVADGQIDRRSAELNARQWLAIAAAVGADLPELEIFCAFPPGAKSRARADDICPREDWLAELARARDEITRRAIADRENRNLAMRSFGLASLAMHLGAPGPQLERAQ